MISTQICSSTKYNYSNRLGMRELECVFLSLHLPNSIGLKTHIVLIIRYQVICLALENKVIDYTHDVFPTPAKTQVVHLVDCNRSLSEHM